MLTSDNNTPDYSRYTIEELEDVLANVDRVKYAGRYAEAKAMLEQKLTQRPIQPESELTDQNAAAAKPSWSEMHATTRFVIVVFLFQIFSLIPGMFYQFMTAKSWSNNTSLWIWGLGGLLAVLWLVSLIKDTKFAQHLTKDGRGKLAAVLMPLLFPMFSFVLIDKSIPLLLHVLAAPSDVSYTMNYRKQSSSKYCRYRVEIVATKHLESGDLCMSESMRNSLPETGKITVLGTRSRFGMVVSGFKPI